MSRNEQEFMEGGDGIKLSLQEATPDPVPKQMQEIVNFMNAVHRRLEDCSVEWQSKISKEQWKLLNSGTISEKPWKQSVLPRTYFANSILDEAFKFLLQQDKIFNKCLKNFIVLLKDEQLLIDQELQDRQENMSCLNTSISNQKQTDFIESLNFISMENHCSTSTQTKTKISDNVISRNLQQSFSNLMKAKLTFDTTFLTFDAAFNGESNVSLDPTKCICKICSNVVEQLVNKQKTSKTKTVSRRRRKRVVKRSNKRLLKSKQVTNRPRRVNNSTSVDQVGDKISLPTNTN